MFQPADYNETEKIFALQRYGGVEPRLLEVLLRQFGDLNAILAAERAAFLEIEGMGEDTVLRLTAVAERLEDARKHLRSLHDREIGLITRFDDAYPDLLFELNDPPPLLYFRGKLPESGQRTIALVGAGLASSDGIAMTSRLAREFVEQGIQVISSLSGGIDAAAHLAVGTAGGRSFAIVENGFDEVPPETNMPVAIDIVRQGGVISELAPDVAGDERAMAQVNRLIVGLSQAVVITEIYHDSARILDLVRFCDDIGKLMFLMIDPDKGAFADKDGLAEALKCGAIPIEGYDRVKDITASLV